MGRTRPSRAAAVTLLVGVLATCVAGCIDVQLFGGLPEPLTETVISGTSGPKILMLKIDGVLSLEPRDERSLLRGPQDNVVSRLREVLDVAGKDPALKAVVLRIDSPGGTATASDVAYREILGFKKAHSVPVVAYLLGTAASGGYYVAMAADAVVAHPTTVTGSIGVLFMGVNVAGLMQKLGIEDQTIKAGRFKDEGSPLRRMTPEERAQIQSVLDDLHTQFKRVVEAGRPKLDAHQVDVLADGRIFSAEQARQRGLVDAVGDLEDAVDLARKRAGLTAARVVTYHRPNEYENNVFTRAALMPSLQLDLLDPLRRFAGPGFYYLWAPGLQ
jgi:protease-4